MLALYSFLEEIQAPEALEARTARLLEQGEKRNDVYRARTNVQRFLQDMMEDASDE